MFGQVQLPGGSDAGHLDLIRPDGTVVCSSRPAAGGTGGLGSYAGTAWWRAALRAPVLTVPAADPRTGQPAVLFTTADGGTVLTRSADPGRWVGAALTGTPFGTGDGVGERRD